MGVLSYFQQKTLPQIIELLRPVRALFLDNLPRAGVLADRRCQEQCKTGPAAHGSRMNFPQIPSNPEIPARKLNNRENTGKILLEWPATAFKRLPLADRRLPPIFGGNPPDTLSKTGGGRYTSFGSGQALYEAWAISRRAHSTSLNKIRRMTLAENSEPEN
ncbi:hypothetical protein AB0V66_03920 [Mesorhizobium ciceri]|uniref:hypothetical protein n=1 Tax=Mesorhizobium ciceri TaxID=39645 RepID=UPI00344DCD17